MRIRWQSALAASAALWFLAGPGAWAAAEEPPAASTPSETAAMAHARGSFTVALEPQAVADSTLGETISRFSAHKQFEGDLIGTSVGEMLGARTAVEGSAGYVAIEVVTGTLQGRTGTFVLQHSGTMGHGAQKLVITIVPDSGTGQLTGIAGTMGIKIVGKQHFYDLEYSLPPE